MSAWWFWRHSIRLMLAHAWRWVDANNSGFPRCTTSTTKVPWKIHDDHFVNSSSCTLDFNTRSPRFCRIFRPPSANHLTDCLLVLFHQFQDTILHQTDCLTIRKNLKGGLMRKTLRNQSLWAYEPTSLHVGSVYLPVSTDTRRPYYLIP